MINNNNNNNNVSIILLFISKLLWLRYTLCLLILPTFLEGNLNQKQMFKFIFLNTFRHPNLYVKQIS